MIKRIISSVLLVIMLFTLWGCDIFGNKYPLGYLYTLEEAYEQGMITKDDLKTIAYYQKERYPEYYEDMYYYFALEREWSFVPSQEITDTLSAETEEQIREAYAGKLSKQSGFAGATAEDVTIYSYCGTYNGYVMVVITDSYHSYNGEMDLVWYDYTSRLSFPLFHFIVRIPKNSDFTLSSCIFMWNREQPEEIRDYMEDYKAGSLQDLMSEEDIFSISYYQKHNLVKKWLSNIASTPKVSNNISEEMQSKVIQTRLDLWKKSGYDGTIDEKDYSYYGIYNGYVVYSDNAVCSGFNMQLKAMLIDDVIFLFEGFIVHPEYINVWKENL